VDKFEEWLNNADWIKVFLTFASISALVTLIVINIVD
jgi:hypothetical protein